MALTLPLLTSSLNNVYGIVSGASPPGTRYRASTKLRSNAIANHSQARPGGIRVGPPPGGAPAGVRWIRPDADASALRVASFPHPFIASPRLAGPHRRRRALAAIAAGHSCGPPEAGVAGACIPEPKVSGTSHA